MRFINILEYKANTFSKVSDVLFESPMTIFCFICSILYHPLHAQTFSKTRAFNFFKFNNLFKYTRWSPYLEIEILRHIVSNPPINSDTKSNSCNSRVGVRGEGNFQSREKGIVSV